MEHISGSTVLNILRFAFIASPSRDLPKYIKTKLLTTCFYLYKALLSNKKRTETRLPASSCAWFLKKNSSCVIF